MQGQWIGVIYLCLLLLFLLGRNRLAFGPGWVRNLALWLAIFVGLILFYQQFGAELGLVKPLRVPHTRPEQSL